MTSVDSTPLVSIVTPSLNQAEFLEDTIRSVLAQDYSAIEYIIVDGGSTDGSVEIIRKYESDLAWWVTEPDEGQAWAINKGMSKARGEYVAWLNSDDLYLPGTVAQAVEEFKETLGVGLVFGDAITIDANGCPIKELVFPDWGLKELLGFRIICQPAVFMRRTLFERVNGLDLSYHYMLDHQLWTRIASLAPIKHVPAMWAAARHHEAAKNVSQAAEFGRETLRVLEWMRSQSDLAPLVMQNERFVLAGAYRLNARYLLDGGFYADSLKSYGQAFINQPGYSLQHWHRIVYATLGLMGINNVESIYSLYQNARRPDLHDMETLKNWPGLCLEQAR